MNIFKHAHTIQKKSFTSKKIIFPCEQSIKRVTVSINPRTKTNRLESMPVISLPCIQLTILDSLATIASPARWFPKECAHIIHNATPPPPSSTLHRILPIPIPPLGKKKKKKDVCRFEPPRKTQINHKDPAKCVARTVFCAHCRSVLFWFHGPEKP